MLKILFNNLFNLYLKSLRCTAQTIFFPVITPHPLNHITTLPHLLHITETQHKSSAAIAHSINLMNRHHILPLSFRIGKSLHP